MFGILCMIFELFFGKVLVNIEKQFICDEFLVFMFVNYNLMVGLMLMGIIKVEYCVDNLIFIFFEGRGLGDVLIVVKIFKNGDFVWIYKIEKCQVIVIFSFFFECVEGNLLYVFYNEDLWNYDFVGEKIGDD